MTAPTNPVIASVRIFVDNSPLCTEKILNWYHHFISVQEDKSEMVKRIKKDLDLGLKETKEFYDAYLHNFFAGYAKFVADTDWVITPPVTQFPTWNSLSDSDRDVIIATIGRDLAGEVASIRKGTCLLEGALVRTLFKVGISESDAHKIITRMFPTIFPATKKYRITTVREVEMTDDEYEKAKESMGAEVTIELK